MSKPPQPSTAKNRAMKPYLDIDESVQYLRDLGFATVTTETIKRCAYRTGQLPRPKVAGRRAYWARADLDALIERL